MVSEPARIVSLNLHGYNGRPQMAVELGDGHLLRVGYHADHTVWAAIGRTRVRISKGIRDLHEAAAHVAKDHHP